MKRRHLFEFSDQTWLPRAFRRYLNELLAHQSADIYAPIAGTLSDALRRSLATEVVDLCSGGGGPWHRMHAMIEELTGREISVTLSDRFPPAPGSSCVDRETATPERSKNEKLKICYEERSTDVTARVVDGAGFYTMFTGFHHFRPELAAAVLDRLAAERVPVGIFEFTERKWDRVLAMLLSPLVVWIDTLHIKPLNFGRLFWTYIVPVVPCIYLWDGLISNLRSYSPQELEDFASSVRVDGYAWEAGSVSQAGYNITFLIGRPSSMN